MLSPAATIDHTLLKPECSHEQLARLCEEAVEWGFAAVCVPPMHVRFCAGRLYGSQVKVATVIGFPFGYAASQAKALEADLALQHGAEEIDMVMAYGAALYDDWDYVEADIRSVTEIAGSVPVKVILECAALDDGRKRRAVEAAVSTGAQFVKTSTGFGAGGATAADVALLHRNAAGRAEVKASGGIRDLRSCREMFEAGATRIGTSSGVEIMRQWQARVSDRTV